MFASLLLAVGLLAAFATPALPGMRPRLRSEKVTIALSKRSVDFFKREARLHGTQYQRMIRALLDRYADAHAAGNKRRSDPADRRY
jgi:hypothetical protein